MAKTAEKILRKTNLPGASKVEIMRKMHRMGKSGRGGRCRKDYIAISRKFGNPIRKAQITHDINHA